MNGRYGRCKGGKEVICIAEGAELHKFLELSQIIHRAESNLHLGLCYLCSSLCIFHYHFRLWIG